MSKKGEDVHIIISEMISLDVSHSLWAQTKLNAGFKLIAFVLLSSSHRMAFIKIII